MRYSALIITLACLPGLCAAQQPKASTAYMKQPAPADDGIFAAFQRHPLVGLSDDHALAQEEDYYVSLISDPRFAKEVGNVVVEFGNASQQQTIDHYVNGEDMPYAELRNVWGDTSYVGWFPTVTALGYLNFYAAVRAVSAKLPIEERIHVWLGGRPVNWAKVRTGDDLAKYIGGQADRFTADLIDQQILSKNKRALLIYGTFHFYDKGTLAELVRQRHPGSLFVVTPYTGFADKSCSERFESETASWSSPALIAADDLPSNQHAPNCGVIDASGFAEMTEAQRMKVRSDMESQSSVLVGNSLLYLAPAGSLTKSPLSPDLYLDPEFRKENDRRAALFGGHADPWPTVKDNPMVPLYVLDYGQKPR